MATAIVPGNVGTVLTSRFGRTLLSLTLFFLLAIGEFVPIVHTIAGYEGILCSLIAWYCSAAILINATHGRTVLPLGERR